MRRKRNKHYLALIKKKKLMCVILDTCNNDKQIRGAISIANNSSHTATRGLKIICKTTYCYKSVKLVYVWDLAVISQAGQLLQSPVIGTIIKTDHNKYIIDISPRLDYWKAIQAKGNIKDISPRLDCQKAIQTDSWREVTSPGVRTIGARYSLSGDSRASTNQTMDTLSVNNTSSVKS